MPSSTLILGSSLECSLSFSEDFSPFRNFSASFLLRLSSSLHLRRSSSRKRFRSSSLLLLSSFFSSLIRWRNKSFFFKGDTSVYAFVEKHSKGKIRHQEKDFTCLFFRKSRRGVVFFADEREKTMNKTDSVRCTLKSV